MTKVIYIRDPEFTDDCWQQYYDLMVELDRRYQTLFSTTSWQDFRKRLLSLAETEKHFHRFIVSEGRQILGWAGFQVQQPGTEHQLVQLDLDALFDEIPSEFARPVATEVIRLLQESGSGTAWSMATNERISAVFRNWGARQLSRVDRYRLHREQANHALMDKWLEEIPERNSRLQPHLWLTIPEEQIERFTELMTQFVHDMPKEVEDPIPFRASAEDIRRRERWRQQNNLYVYTYALLDRGEQLVAFSCAFINGDDPKQVYQALTGVVSEYRGRGLSKWLKVILFDKIGADFPRNESFITDMRAVNEPIQAVNARMGYMLESRGYEYEISRQQLTRYLK